MPNDFDKNVMYGKQNNWKLQIVKKMYDERKIRPTEDGHVEVWCEATNTWLELKPKPLEDGYTKVTVQPGKRVYEHDAVFIATYGYIPGELDHKDKDKANNRVSNLKETTHRDNQKNRVFYAGHDWTVEDFDELKAAFAAGVKKNVALPAMAQKYGCSARTIRNRAKDLGIYWVNR